MFVVYQLNCCLVFVHSHLDRNDQNLPALSLVSVCNFICPSEVTAKKSADNILVFCMCIYLSIATVHIHINSVHSKNKHEHAECILDKTEMSVHAFIQALDGVHSHLCTDSALCRQES